MDLELIDILIIIAFFVGSLVIGIVVSKQAGSNTAEFFLSGRNMPWWLLGVSMVATTFSVDTPNLVADFVRTDGVSGNWAWWAFLITGMVTVFLYAKLWRRSNIMTDLEFYEMRYSGKEAAFLRGFRSVYLGVFFNILIMATVCLAGMKVGAVMLGLEGWKTLLIAGSITVAYSMLGGLKGVVITDFFQFILAMIGTILASIYIVNLPEVGGLQNMLTHANVADKISIFPDFSNTELVVTLFVIPIAVQWWAVWYPGGEPGGGGYIVQRILSAKDEKNAVMATLFFNAAHYALRPWPWILIALASLIVFPELDSMRSVFPEVEDSLIGHDLAFPAMLTLLPSGLLGLVIAALIAAFMSTISTHLNWGSSYIVNDFYERFLNKNASSKSSILVGRLSTVVLMVFAAVVALYMTNAKQAFGMLVQVGAGTGLIYILRWFWWRVNAYAEIVGMVVAAVIAIYFQFISTADIPSHHQLLIAVGVTTVAWLLTVLITKPTDDKVLRDFYRLVKPAGPGWKAVLDKAEAENDPIKTDSTGQLPLEILCVFIGCFIVYGALFSVGYFIYGDLMLSLGLGLFSLLSTFVLFRVWKNIKMD